jgi:hypothetical protein
MATSGTDRIQFLLELGEADQRGAWPDYLQYGFTEADILALLDLVADEILDEADSESSEVWAPLHAWRTLGQLGSSQAIVPLLNQFDRLCEDDWALPELPTVMGMLGEPAIEPLAGFLMDTRHKEFARIMALDGLAEIVKRLLDCRERVIRCYKDYMRTPDDSAIHLTDCLSAACSISRQQRPSRISGSSSPATAWTLPAPGTWKRWKSNWVSGMNAPHPNRTTQNCMGSIRQTYRRNRTVTISWGY